MIRKPIITVLGHVDAGKTRFLDFVRGTSVIEKEAGGITQHIGATEVPIEVITKISGDLLERYGFKLNIPGLLFIDTPGHEAFTNLRERGGSIADLAVLVIDINKGFQEQTLEAIEILKSFKVPFVIVANKIDTMFDWESNSGSITKNLKQQGEKGLTKLDKQIYEIVGQMHEKGFQAERFDRVQEITKQVPIIPISAKTGEGFPEVLMFLAGLSQKYLEKKLNIEVSGPGKGTILEVKEEKGLGKTIDVILYDGKIKIGDKIAVIGKSGIINTKVRALLQPNPLDEMRDPEKRFSNAKEVSAAAGIKIVAPNFGDVLSGSPIIVVESDKDIERLKEEIKEIKIENDVVGPILKTDTLGSLEALTLMLEKQNLKIRRADIGDLSKRDLIEIKAIQEKDYTKGVIFLFNVKIPAELEKEAKELGIKIFRENVVYRLIENYEEWLKDMQEKKKKERLEHIVYPAELKVIPGNVFRNSKPAIVGIDVIAGKLKSGIKVMKKDGTVVGEIRAIQSEGENVKEVEKGKEVAVSIDGATIGRNLNERDTLYSYIPEKHFEEMEKFSSDFNAEEQELIALIKKIKEKVSKKEEN